MPSRLSTTTATPAFRADAPYVVALIELDEGVRMMSNLVEVTPDPQHVRVGLPVEVVYEDVTPEMTLPKFRPACGRVARLLLQSTQRAQSRERRRRVAPTLALPRCDRGGNLSPAGAGGRLG